jgi:hypothetical protein
MDFHVGALANYGEGGDRGQLAGAIVEPRPRPHIAKRIGLGSLGKERKLLPHPFKVWLGQAIVQLADHGRTALASVLGGLSQTGIRHKAERYDGARGGNLGSYLL